MVTDVQWLEELFTDYDLYYLDPLVIKDAVPPDFSPPEKGRRLFMGPQDKPPETEWFQRDIETTSTILAQVRQILRVDETNKDISQYFEGGILANLLEDRGMQKQIVGALVNGLRRASITDPKAAAKPLETENRGMVARVIDALTNWRKAPPSLDGKNIEGKRIVDDSSGLDGNFESFQKMPNRNTVECLVALDGRITYVDGNTNSGLYQTYELYQSVAVTPFRVDRQPRLIRFCLSERPGPLMDLDCWRIGLMVDKKGLAKTYPNDCYREGAVNAVERDGWYPFARAIGFWRTDSGGRPFVDILAILIKTFPSMDTIFRKRGKSNERCIVELLQNGKVKVEKKKGALSSKSLYDASGDYDLIYPYYLATLCCHLNNTGWEKFEVRGRVLYDLSKQYWDALVELAKEMKTNDIPSWLPGLVEFEERRRSEIVEK